MDMPGESRGIGASLMPVLERLPVLSGYAKSRGWHYILCWLQRFTGVGLLLFLTVHLYGLPSLQSPGGRYAAMLQMAAVPPALLFLAWASSLAVGFHTLNGGRLILYELFGRRNDATLVRWVFVLSAAYAGVVGLLMRMGNQRASAFFFWLIAGLFGTVAAYVVASRLRRKRHSVPWKLQRISGAFLFCTVPAYLLSLWLDPGGADGVKGVMADLERLFPRAVALILAACTLYHAAYGLYSIAADYAPSPRVRVGMTALTVSLIAALAALAGRFIFSP